jgi:transposase
MGFRHISIDNQETGLRLRERGRDSDEEIADVCGFSVRTLQCAAERKRLTGTVAHRPAVGRGRHRSYVRADADYLLTLARNKPTRFLDEYRDWLDKYRHLSLSVTTLHRVFERAGLRVKQVQKLASERDPQRRAAFIREVGQYPANYILAIDEVSKDERTYARLWGRAPIGERVEKHDPFVRGRRFSMCAALVLDEGIVASRVVEGSFDRQRFIEFLRDDVVRGISYPISLANE